VSLVIDEHRQYLADTNRLTAFDRAIREVVRPGDVVLDLASGTGILGLLACRAGARRVYAIDEGGIVGLAREVARANGFADRITTIREHSTRVELPERADVLVTDQIGRLGFEEGLVEYVADARRRLLKPGARIVPAAVTLRAAPIEAPAAHDAVRFWSQPVAGFDISAVLGPAASTGYPITIASAQLLSDAVSVGCLFFADGDPPAAPIIEATVQRAGTLHGLGGWFEARLSPTVTMTNSPLASERINRRQAFLPIDRAMRVAIGDRVGITIRVVPGTLIVQWTVAVTPAHADRPADLFSNSTFNGMLLSVEDTRHGDPQSVPVLTPAGRGRQTVLALCDGRHDLSAIERQVFERHRDLFAGPAEAAAFVAEVVSRYTSAS
jgi:protein arginine N-methyltransferase 1